ncbi:MAG: CoA-binding protein, partial [Planctomycetes bacterium]|nr:CoA-binding protein [Planctomycetota bacterium]
MTALAAIFAPKSIAVVGASENPEKLGHILLKNLLDGGYAGEVYPVGAGTAPELLGRRLLPAVRDVPRGVDLALVAVANESTGAALKEAAAIGPKAILLLSSGFGEGPLAAQLLAKEAGAIRAQGITRILGPNGSGVCDAHAGLNASYV